GDLIVTSRMHTEASALLVKPDGAVLRETANIEMLDETRCGVSNVTEGEGPSMVGLDLGPVHVIAIPGLVPVNLIGLARLPSLALPSIVPARRRCALGARKNGGENDGVTCGAHRGQFRAIPGRDVHIDQRWARVPAQAQRSAPARRCNARR